MRRASPRPVPVLICIDGPPARSIADALERSFDRRWEISIESEAAVPDLLGQKLQAELVFIPADLVDAHRQLRTESGHPPAVIAVHHGDPDLAREALRAGADDVLGPDEMSPQMIARAARGALALREQENELTVVKAQHALMLASSRDGLWEWDLMTDRVVYSSRWKAKLGLADEEVTSGPEAWFSRVHPDDIAALRADLQGHIDGGRAYHEFEHRVRHRDGEFLWVISRAMVRRDEWGRPLDVAGSLTDVSKRKHAEVQLHHSQMRDALTGLSARSVLVEQLEQAIGRSTRFAVVFVNLDRFRVVNDSIGIESGDRILVELGARMRRCLTEALVCRYGGDEFAAFIRDYSDDDIPAHAATAIHESLKRPFELEGATIFASASIGITSSDKIEYTRPAEVLRDVALATQAAKRGSDSESTTHFDPSMRRAAVNEHRLQNALRQAVNRREFVVYYQPIVDVEDGLVTGFEALIRWQHPTRGLVSPGEFIPAAEETGLVVPIGQFILREACRQMAQWRREKPEAGNVYVSVNLSGLQIATPGLIEDIERVLDEVRLEPSALKLELTESTLIDDPNAAVKMLDRLRERGVRIYIDDFGTGYSSLTYLHRFAIDGLKIDKSFVDLLANDDGKSAIVGSIVSLAQSLKVGVVAEGVETEEQLKTLRWLDCGEAQGYYFSRPVPSERAGRLLGLRLPEIRAVRSA